VEAANEHAADGRDLERYEQLRRHALAGEASGCRLGLALLQHRGVAAWMRAWQPTPPAPPAPATSEAVAGGDQLVGVLATMALACLAAG
jgi:hypothetical protein